MLHQLFKGIFVKFTCVHNIYATEILILFVFFCLTSFSSIKHSFLKVSLDLSASYLVVSDVIKKVRK